MRGFRLFIGYVIKGTLFTFMIFGLNLSGCTQDDGPATPQETVGTPTSPQGPDSTAVNKTENYSTGGSVSSMGHDLEYRFDLGDGNLSSWTYAGNVSYSWSTEGVYAVKAQARCATHTDIISSWSKKKTVVAGEAVTTPDVPVGPLETDVGNTETFSTGGSTSSSGHSVEYRFDWGDGSQSSWSSSSQTSHSWPFEGDFGIRAQARCEIHTTRVSLWSDEVTIRVGEVVSPPDTPEGRTPVTVGRIKVYCSDGAASSRGHPIHYQFEWEECTFPLWSSSNCVSIYWPNVGTYAVKARARCAIHPEAVSSWSNPIMVLITDHEVITTPDCPLGASSTTVDRTETYTTGGAFSSSDHTLEYRFDWGDGSQSSWSSSINASYHWSAEGSYIVMAQARCARHNGNISSWSNGLTVTVTGQ